MIKKMNRKNQTVMSSPVSKAQRTAMRTGSPTHSNSPTTKLTKARTLVAVAGLIAVAFGAGQQCQQHHNTGTPADAPEHPSSDSSSFSSLIAPSSSYLSAPFIEGPVNEAAALSMNFPPHEVLYGNGSKEDGAPPFYELVHNAKSKAKETELLYRNPVTNVRFNTKESAWIDFDKMRQLFRLHGVEQILTTNAVPERNVPNQALLVGPTGFSGSVTGNLSVLAGSEGVLVNLKSEMSFM
jgi:hypothetical protein